MKRTFSASPLEPIAYYPQRDGKAKVWLRRNIACEATEDGDKWSADEVSLVTRLPLAEVDQSFDALWQAAERAEMTAAQRLDELDGIAADGIGALGELGAMVGEVQAALGELGAMVAGGGEQHG